MQTSQPDIREAGLQFKGKPQKRVTTDLIVLHHAAAAKCSVEDVHQWHLGNGWLGIGYHYFVDKAGHIYRGRPEDAIGAHCEGHNDHSIGVCAEGDFTQEQMSAKQQVAIAGLVGWLLSRHPSGTAKRHGDLCATKCPGQYYPFDQIVAGKATPTWDPAAELRRLRDSGLVNSGHRPEDPVTWGELATVLNRLARS